MILRVTNKNKFTLEDRYDGINYVFETNKPVVIEEEAARHFFGYGIADKVPFLVRQGWCVSSDKTDEAMKKLNNFVFEQGSVEFKSEDDEKVVDEDDDISKLQSKIKQPVNHARMSPITA